MKINEEFGNRVRMALESQPVCIKDKYRYDGIYIIRCPFCGDSVKNRNKGHFYIKVRPNEDEPMWVKCHRCGTGGIMDEYILSLLNIYDDDISLLSKQHKINMTKKFGYKGFINNNNNIKLLPPLNNIYTQNKLDYLNNRLGIKLTQEDIFKYKIIFNLRDFLNYNNIKNYTRNELMIDNLDKLYVGFLSSNNEYINFRIIDDKLIDNYNTRYINYNIFGSNDNTRRFITVKNKINIMKKIDIITCEGPMDLMGIREHVYNKNDKNKIYVANMGMSCESVMNNLIKRGIIFNNLKIFADQGVNINLYRDIKRKLGYKYKGDNIEVFYNVYKDGKKCYKDFGFPKDKIKIKSYII